MAGLSWPGPLLNGIRGHKSEQLTVSLARPGVVSGQIDCGDNGIAVALVFQMVEAHATGHGYAASVEIKGAFCREVEIVFPVKAISLVLNGKANGIRLALKIDFDIAFPVFGPL